MIVMLTEESNNIIVVYLLLPWQQLPNYTFSTFLLTFSLYFMACSPYLICNNYYKKYVKDSYNLQNTLSVLG